MFYDLINEPHIAYFSMEIALRDDLPTYSGGLGVLAGDTLRSAADLDIPIVGVTLVSRAGYFKQDISDQGNQTSLPDPWQPEEILKPLPAKIAVEIEGREVWVRGWLYTLESLIGRFKPVILLDTDLEENSDQDRSITHYLYGGDAAYRMKQEIVLGIGGVRMLNALGFSIKEFHMNEGHSAFLGLELLNRFAYSKRSLLGAESKYDIHRIREMCNFTTHTPVEAGHDKFPYELVNRILGDVIDSATLKRLGGNQHLNMTQLALNLSEYVNGVAKKHAETSEHLFPGYRVHSIPNGVHPGTWTCTEFNDLYDRYLPGWCHEPELLVRVDQVPDGEIWNAHICAKQRLIDHIKRHCHCDLNPDLPIIGFARRMTAYKRPDLLFSNLQRLEKIAQKTPFQLVFAGKAHPNDQKGRELIHFLYEQMGNLKDKIPMIFLTGYDMKLAKLLVAGVDLWLNTPLRPLEASGTSGMKATFNGVPNLSVLDGWWLEGCIEGVTGWAIGESTESANGDDAYSLYDKLENTILPMYHNNRPAWITVMKGAISKNASYFNTHRMMRRYVSEAYLR